jgi:hypothetical protein
MRNSTMSQPQAWRCLELNSALGGCAGGTKRDSRVQPFPLGWRHVSTKWRSRAVPQEPQAQIAPPAAHSGTDAGAAESHG